MPAHVKTGDRVIVTSGDFKGAVGTVRRVIPDKQRVVVEGVNTVTRHQKPTRTNPQGGTVTREAPIHMSKVSPVVDGKPSRVRYLTKPDGGKVRIAVRGGGEFGTPLRMPTDRKHAAGAKKAKPSKAAVKSK
ncbi:hypothetical protein BH11PLA1_BH11PLA1_22780 [soil metagenome]